MSITRADFENTCQKAARSQYIGDNLCLCRVLGSSLMYVDTRDHVHAPHLMMDGFWESWITVAMMRALRPGMVAVDVGANLGYYTIVMGKSVGPAGRVIACEPNQRLVKIVKQSLLLCGLAEITTIENRAAHSVSNTVANFYVPDGRPMNAAIISNDAKFAGGVTLEVKTVRLDEVLPQTVDFIKIDTEGAEAQVWKGLSRTLESNPNIRVFLEFNPKRTHHYDPRALLGQFEGQGFKLGTIDYEGGTIAATAEEIIAQGTEVMLDLARS
jgi:FkbM family methyltransferase